LEPTGTIERADPVAIELMQRYLDQLAAKGFTPEGQGVWIQSSDQELAEHLGSTPLPAASLTKIATTLVSLSTWGTEYQLDTLISTNGQIRNGVLKGDLLVQGGGDPFFVWEEAFSLGNTLNQMGIRQITGDVLVTGKFAMNFETDPITAGTLLKQGLNASLWSDEALAQYQQLPADTPRPQVAIDGTVRLATPDDATGILRPLVRHRSLPMVNILKGMNIYSNNVIADMLADNLGGADMVAQKAATLAQVPPEEISLINGSGLGEENRISPRAVAAMLIAIQQYLQPRQMTVADLFPVVGQDGGTMKGRQIPAGAVLKTGTLDAVSALAGVVPTRDRGLVWFTLINLGTGDLQLLHDQQDALLQQIEQTWGAATPLPPSITPNRNWKDTYRLGAIERNQAL
ncbi:MAG TPA: D-alanyl-D-alanine carboxypeptidase, partial [Allocoleopsis sp.]